MKFQINDIIIWVGIGSTKPRKILDIAGNKKEGYQYNLEGMGWYNTESVDKTAVKVNQMTPLMRVKCIKEIWKYPDINEDDTFDVYKISIMPIGSNHHTFLLINTDKGFRTVDAENFVYESKLEQALKQLYKRVPVLKQRIL